MPRRLQRRVSNLMAARMAKDGALFTPGRVEIRDFLAVSG
jgi:hypothetical protein